MFNYLPRLLFKVLLLVTQTGKNCFAPWSNPDISNDTTKLTINLSVRTVRFDRAQTLYLLLSCKDRQ